MRTPLILAVSAALLLASSCSKKEEAAPPTAAAPSAAAPAPTTPAAAAPVKETVFGREELDQMVAPIALYPDSLLAQVLMAATYPGDVADAATWSKAHPDEKGDAAVKQVADQSWDPSVQSLVAFPQALQTLGQDPAWVQNLGDAFLAQPDDVMDAVQRLRHQAQDAGNLSSNEYQKVAVQPAAPAPAQGAVDTAPAAAESSTITIEPTNPQVVYVPSYNPTTTYGTWAYPSYPPAYYPPPSYYYPAGSALVSGMMFGVGMAITDSLWGDCDWDDHDVHIDVDRYNNINVNRQISANNNTWRHNSVNRDGVPYRDRNNRDLNGRRLDGGDQRAAFRGEDESRSRAREQARSSMERHGVDAPARTNQQARDSARNAARERSGDLGRDPARDRAQSVARDRTGGADRDRAQSAARDRTGSADRTRAQSAAKSRPTAANRAKQTQPNAQARSQARSQASQRQAPRNNAFDGASRPAASHSAAQRGRSSQASASRPAASRSAGKPVQRSSRPPQRQTAHRR